MKTAGREKVCTTHSREHEPALSVSPGETFAVETVLCAGPWLQAIAQYAVTRDLLDWLVTGYGLEEKEAWLLMGQLLETRCTQFVNPKCSYICTMPQWYLP